jgi:hypothetical protein
MRVRAVLLLLFFAVIVAACSSGGGTASPKASGPSYASVDAIAAKLRAADLGCAKYQKEDINIDIEGLPKPKDQKFCEVGNGKLGTVITQITIESDSAATARAEKAAMALACGFHPSHLPYEVGGSNWKIGTAYNKKLTDAVAAATGGVASQPKLKC